jgi:uracil-DNA glycosylase family 4
MKITKDIEFDSLIDVVQACDSCARMCGSKRVLNRGCGPLNARIVVIGEAPGRLGADATQLPFHGDKAGHNFEKLLEMVGITREELFITNAALCNPKDANGNNSTPSDSELAACAVHLRRQIELIDPWLVLTLGAAALKAVGFIEPHKLELRNAVRSSFRWYRRELIPLYHPGQRAMIHRSFANQLADYNFVAEKVRRLGSKGRPPTSPASADVAMIAKELLYRGGARSYFSLHKLCYLAEVSFAKSEGRRMTRAYYIRQKDGPYCVDLHLQRLKAAGVGLETSTRAGKTWVSLSSTGLFGEEERAPLPALEASIIDSVLRQYASVSDDRLKTISYLTTPMRQILRREKAGSNQINAPILFM